jgi:hypothetical protein
MYGGIGDNVTIIKDHGITLRRLHSIRCVPKAEADSISEEAEARLDFLHGRNPFRYFEDKSQGTWPYDKSDHPR